MNEEKILQEFKKTLLDFIDELIDMFPNEGEIIILRIFLNDQVPIKTTITNFISKLNSIPNKKQNVNIRKLIKDRNEECLLENNLLFNSVPEEKIKKFHQLWKLLDGDDKKTMWKWIDVLVYQSDKYKI